MKKILVLLLVLSGISLAQSTTTPLANKVDGKYTLYKDATGNYRSNAVHITNDLTTPLYTSSGDPYERSVDTWGAASDTSTYAFANAYLKAYVTVYDTSATADTLVFEHYSYAKNAYTTQAIGIRDILTDYLEADNSTVIIPAATAKTFEVNMFRPGTLRIRPKTITGRLS